MKDRELLQALRDRVLDEDQPVPALLRLCLMLGQRSGSDELRVWARRELNGYGSDDVLPTYRSISEPPMFADSTNGVQIAHHQMLSRWDVPEQLREFIPEPLLLRQPINELEHMAATFGSGAPFTHAGLQALAALWNQRNRGSTLTMIERIYFVVGASQVSGVVDRVRTSLVDMIADLTADIGFDQLPDKRKVDTSVQIHMYGHGDQNSVIIQGDNHGVIGGRVRLATDSEPQRPSRRRDQAHRASPRRPAPHRRHRCSGDNRERHRQLRGLVELQRA